MQRYRRHLIETFGKIFVLDTKTGLLNARPAQLPITADLRGKWAGEWCGNEARKVHAEYLAGAALMRYERQRGGSYMTLVDGHLYLERCRNVRQVFRKLP